MRSEMKGPLGHARLLPVVVLLASVLVIEPVSSESSLEGPHAEGSQLMVSGAIDYEVFLDSVPQRMVVGETYTIVLIAKNTGDTKADFLIGLYFPFQSLTKYFYILGWEMNTVFTLYPGESKRAEFYITAVNPHTGPLEIVGYLLSSLSDQTLIVDSVSATLYEIRLAVPVETTTWIMGVIALCIFAALAIKFLRKTETRAEFVVLSLIFLGALTLRVSNISLVATYPDELNIWAVGLDILQNNWAWRKIIMWGGYPPLFYYLSAVMTYLFGSGLEAIRSVSAIFGGLTVVPVYLLGKSLFGRKAGLLSAVLLTFSSFHMLYSRISMTEGLMVFLTATSSYLFWRGYKKKSWSYMCLSGIFLGLGLNTKYIAAVAAAAAILFIIWIERSWRPFLKKNFLIWLAAILLVVSPVQLSLLMNGVNPYWWYFSQAFGQKTGNPGFVWRPFVDLVPRGLRLQVYLNARTASPWLPWLSLYELAIVVLFTAVFAYYAYHSLKAREEESFLTCFFLVPIVFAAINPWKGTHWLIYALPYYLVMLSGFVFRYICNLSVHNEAAPSLSKGLRSHAGIPKILLLMLVAILVSSNTLVGALAPAIDVGEFDGARLGLLYVKSRAHQGDFISGWWWNYYIYYINLYDLNVTYIPLDTASPEAISEALRSETLITYDQIVLNDDVVTTVKPRFIIINRLYLDTVFNATMKEVLLNNYELVWQGQPSVGYFWGKAETNHQIWLVFEKKPDV